MNEKLWICVLAGFSGYFVSARVAFGDVNGKANAGG